MKKKEFKTYKEKTIVELKKELGRFRERLVILKFDLAAGKVKNIRDIRAVKKSIAQILTLLNKEKNEKT
ncbi:MAG: 50S ribosomal protein L29 [Patescibacteria group bacterium]